MFSLVEAMIKKIDEVESPSSKSMVSGLESAFVTLLIGCTAPAVNGTEFAPLVGSLWLTAIAIGWIGALGYAGIGFIQNTARHSQTASSTT